MSIELRPSLRLVLSIPTPTHDPVAKPPYPYSLRQTPPERHYARICCTPEATASKQEIYPTGEWQLVDAVQLQCLRSQASAGNLAYGSGSHWVERTYTATSPRA